MGQQNNEFPKKKKGVNKGKFFACWGWNGSSYTDLNIRFQCDNYDFIVQNVTAQDPPLKFTFSKYFEIKNLTKPQTIGRIGYFCKENGTL